MRLLVNSFHFVSFVLVANCHLRNGDVVRTAHNSKPVLKHEQANCRGKLCARQREIHKNKMYISTECITLWYTHEQKLSTKRRNNVIAPLECVMSKNKAKDFNQMINTHTISNRIISFFLSKTLNLIAACRWYIVPTDERNEQWVVIKNLINLISMDIKWI